MLDVLEGDQARVGQVDMRLGLAVQHDRPAALSVGLESNALCPGHADGGGTHNASIAEAMRVSRPTTTMNHPMTT